MSDSEVMWLSIGYCYVVIFFASVIYSGVRFGDLVKLSRIQPRRLRHRVYIGYAAMLALIPMLLFIQEVRAALKKLRKKRGKS